MMALLESFEIWLLTLISSFSQILGHNHSAFCLESSLTVSKNELLLVYSCKHAAAENANRWMFSINDTILNDSHISCNYIADCLLINPPCDAETIHFSPVQAACNMMEKICCSDNCQFTNPKVDNCTQVRI